MKIECMVLGAVATNCYFVINEETKETIVIDPADRADVILKKAAEEGLTLKAVFLTHGHGDHIMAVPGEDGNSGLCLQGRGRTACRSRTESVHRAFREAAVSESRCPDRGRPGAYSGRHEIPGAVHSRPHAGRLLLLQRRGRRTVFGRHSVLRLRGPDRFSGRKHGNPGPLHFREADAPSRRDESVSGSSGRDDHRR